MVYIPEHAFRILIIGGSGSGKTNVLLNLTKHLRPNIDRICKYMKGLFEWTHQLVFVRKKKGVIKELKNPKPFIDYSQPTDDWWDIIKFRRL